MAEITIEVNNPVVGLDDLKKDKYKVDRALAYPSIADQLDTIFHDGLDVWKEQIQAVKDKYPKA